MLFMHTKKDVHYTCTQYTYMDMYMCVHATNAMQISWGANSMYCMYIHKASLCQFPLSTLYHFVLSIDLLTSYCLMYVPPNKRNLQIVYDDLLLTIYASMYIYIERERERA